MGLLERHSEKGKSQFRTVVLSGRKKGHLQPVVRQHIDAGATVKTDAHFSYQGNSRATTRTR
jgi:hypothetical protein